MAADGFLTPHNFDFLVKIFEKYMLDRQNITIPPESISEVRKMLFSVVTSVSNTQPSNTNLKELNNIVLNDLRDLYLKVNNLSSNVRKPNYKSLTRERDLYGNRMVISDQLKPEVAPPSKEDVKKQFEIILAARTSTSATIPDIEPALASQKEVPMTANDLSAMLKKLESMRDIPAPLPPPPSDENTQLPERLVSDIATIQTESDPKALYELGMTSAKATEPTLAYMAKPVDPISTFETMLNASSIVQSDVVPPQYPQRTITRYLLLNGQDRKWDTYPYRFEFALDTDDINTSFKNVLEVQINQLIIPLEAKLPANVTNPTTDSLTKPTFYNRYGMNSPYLIIRIDEIANVYDSLNPITQKSTAVMVFDKAYTTDSGRGFMILKPAQNESKIFYPNPLSTLPKMSFHILRPNGMLLSYTKDENSIDGISYNSADTNRLYMRLYTSKYFDKNDLQVGDVVIIKKFKLPSVAEFVARAQSELTVTPSQEQQDLYAQGKNTIETFMNRPEGHEVQALGQGTTLLKDFAIFIPRILNNITGNYDIDGMFANALNAYFGNTNTTTFSMFSTMKLPKIAPMLNSTLQVTVAMTLQLGSADVLPGLQTAMV
jgi:hypothetical protein